MASWHPRCGVDFGGKNAELSRGREIRNSAQISVARNMLPHCKAKIN